MKTSFVATIFNEEKTIDAFIKSIDEQTKRPDEILLVDGGSSDNTVEKVKKYRHIKLFSHNGNRSQGRNYGIAKAKGDVILVSDAGCTLDKNWVKNITEPFDNEKIDVVSGYYLPVTHNAFEQCLATYTCVMPDRVDRENFLPSSRSVAFKKTAWKEVGGYPEFLDTCEDLVFVRNLKKKDYRFFFAENAIVYWRQRKNIIEAFKQFYGYAVGDGMAHYFRSRTPFLFIRYAFAVGLLFPVTINKSTTPTLLSITLFVLYILWTIKKNYRYIKNIAALFWLPLLQFTSDIAVILGTTVGIILSLLSPSKI